MQMAVFNARCPYEIGDRIKVLKPATEDRRRNGEIYMIEFAAITDIACTHFLKTGKVQFMYELDGSGEYIPLMTPEQANLHL